MCLVLVPAYALPAGLPEMPNDFDQVDQSEATAFGSSTGKSNNLGSQGLPMPATSPTAPSFRNRRGAKGSFLPNGEPILLPARNPPPFGIFDIFPLTLLVKPLLRHGFDIDGKRAQKIRAKLSGGGGGRGPTGEVVSHNIPLEITLYLVRIYVDSTQGLVANSSHSLPTFLPFSNANVVMSRRSTCFSTP